MKKTYILDTNVLVHDPQAIYSFQENDVVIPSVVIEELDSIKKGQDMAAKNSRKVSRELDNLRKKGNFSEGVDLKNGGQLKVHNNKDTENIPHYYDKNKSDNKILSTVLSLQSDLVNYHQPVVLVSKDINMRIKADTLGVNKAEDYSTDKVEVEELYEGIKEFDVAPKKINELYDLGKVYLDKDLQPNEFFNIKSGNQSGLGVYKNGEYKLVDADKYYFNIQGRNREQVGALNLLANKSIEAVSLIGKAGTGKTLMALAVGLQQVLDKDNYEKMIVARPIMPMGKDIGYLPGDKDDKLKNWMKPIADNLSFLLDSWEGSVEDNIASLKDNNKLEMEALTYIRGRSIPNQFLIVDEAQNLTPHEVKTIITRAGEGTKIVLTGDPYQIDHPYLDSESNGLTYFAEKTKDKNITGHITLIKGERSELAQMGANVL